jgi:putative hydrolase of the HAD superfamily
VPAYDHPARPDVLFLDVGDTLIRPEPSWAGVYVAALADHGIHVAEDDLRTAFASAMASEHWRFDGPFEATEEAAWERILQFDRTVLDALGHRDLPETLFRALEQRFGAHASWHVFPDVVPALHALRAAGVRLAVISNWTWAAVELLHDLELASHFEAFAISARVGYNKPNPGIFRHALELTGVAPGRAMHVGDQYRADVLGARGVGIRPVLIERTGRDAEALGIPEDDRADVTIVRDLFELLERIAVPIPAGAPGS